MFGFCFFLLPPGLSSSSGRFSSCSEGPDLILVHAGIQAKKRVPHWQFPTCDLAETVSLQSSKKTYLGLAKELGKASCLLSELVPTVMVRTSR